MTKLTWPKQAGAALTPLSPHNQEISDGSAQSDRDYFDEQERAKKARISAKKKGKETRVFVSKAAQRADFGWEMRIWNTLHSKGLAEIGWGRQIANSNGQRTFSAKARKLRVVCDLDNSTSWLISPGRREKYEWVEVRVGQDRAHQEDIAVFQAIIWDLLADQSKLKECKNA